MSEKCLWGTFPGGFEKCQKNVRKMSVRNPCLTKMSKKCLEKVGQQNKMSKKCLEKVGQQNKMSKKCLEKVGHQNKMSKKCRTTK